LITTHCQVKNGGKGLGRGDHFPGLIFKVVQSLSKNPDANNLRQSKNVATKETKRAKPRIKFRCPDRFVVVCVAEIDGVLVCCGGDVVVGEGMGVSEGDGIGVPEGSGIGVSEGSGIGVSEGSGTGVGGTGVGGTGVGGIGVGGTGVGGTGVGELVSVGLVVGGLVVGGLVVGGLVVGGLVVGGLVVGENVGVIGGAVTDCNGISTCDGSLD